MPRSERSAIGPPDTLRRSVDRDDGTAPYSAHAQSGIRDRPWDRQAEVGASDGQQSAQAAPYKGNCTFDCRGVLRGDKIAAPDTDEREVAHRLAARSEVFVVTD